MVWEYAKVTTFLGKDAGQVVIEILVRNTSGIPQHSRTWIEGHGIAWQAFLENEFDDLRSQGWEFVDSVSAPLMPRAVISEKIFHRFRRALPQGF